MLNIAPTMIALDHFQGTSTAIMKCSFIRLSSGVHGSSVTPEPRLHDMFRWRLKILLDRFERSASGFRHVDPQDNQGQRGESGEKEVRP